MGEWERERVCVCVRLVSLDILSVHVLKKCGRVAYGFILLVKKE